MDAAAAATTNTQQLQHHQTNDGVLLPQANLFIYKGVRDCKSAPPRTFPIRPDSTTSSSSITSSSSMSQNNEKKTKSCTPTTNSSSSSWTRKYLINFLFGHAPQFTTWTTSSSSKTRVLYYSLFTLETLLRSIGDVTLCSNPFSGLLILIGMLISCPRVAFLGVVAVISGVGTGLFLVGVPMREVRCCGVLFNNFLGGSDVGMLVGGDGLVVEEKETWLVAVCIVVGVFTVIIWRGMNGFLSSRCEFPLLNAPFHFMLLLYIFSGLADQFKSGEIKPPPLEELVENSTIMGNNNDTVFTNSKVTIDLEKLIHGVLLAPSHVFGTNTIITSGLVYSAILVYSPIMGLQSLSGAGFGTLIGIILSEPEDGYYTSVYDGSWGYNSLLTSAALGGFFLVFNFYSWVLGIVGSVISALVYSGMVKLNIPPLGIPFMLTTWLLLPNNNDEFLSNNNEQDNKTTDNESSPIPTTNKSTFPFKQVGPFIRIRLSDITTPERNLLRWIKIRRSNNDENNVDKNEKYKQNSSSVLPL